MDQAASCAIGCALDNTVSPADRPCMAEKYGAALGGLIQREAGAIGAAASDWMQSHFCWKQGSGPDLTAQPELP